MGTQLPENVTRDEVQQLVTAGAQLVEVLPREAYEDLHIAGALSIPLRELGERAPAELDPGRPVIAYCHDFL
jgi:rhodanese-related sulfurtransferase